MKQHKPFLFPSQLEQIAQKELPSKSLRAIKYNGKEKSAEATFIHNLPIII